LGYKIELNQKANFVKNDREIDVPEYLPGSGQPSYRLPRNNEPSYVRNSQSGPFSNNSTIK